MDAEFQERRRDSELSRREKRWSMNSQRLEEIVAELMKPISDVRRSFDTDLSALLEEYLTEAGLHALEAGEDADGGGGGGGGGAPNFAELALLLQHSASLYGRKVDFLYQHVLTVSDSLQASTAEASGSGSGSGGAEEPATPSGKRKRRSSGAAAGDFAPLELTASAAARREGGAPRPPPTLPRSYVELEPRQITDHDVPLLDYDQEPIGLLADFQVTWRLQEGLLVDTLESSQPEASAALRPIPLLELQAALDAAAPPPPPPPPHCSTPLPSHTPPPPAHTPTPPEDTPPPAALPPPKRERKRRSDERNDPAPAVKILVSKELRRKLSKKCEFTVSEEWIRCVVRARKDGVLAARRARARREDLRADFRGFDCTDSIDIGGFPGWSCAEGTAARASLRLDDSDDDGFFEQSSLGDSDGSRGDDSQLSSHSHSHPDTSSLAVGEAAWGSWQRAVVEAAAAGEARGLHVEQLAVRVLARLQRGAPRAWPAVAAAARPGDVAGLFLATLFLADAGNVRLLPGAPLSLDSFAVQLVTADRRRLTAALHHHATEPRDSVSR